MLNASFIERYFSEMRQILDTISREDIDRVIEALFAAWRDGRTVFLMGNGGSASTATHFACDLSKITVCEGRPRLRAISLCDNPALISALTNDEGFAHIFSEQIRSLMRPGRCPDRHQRARRQRIGQSRLVVAEPAARHAGGQGRVSTPPSSA